MMKGSCLCCGIPLDRATRYVAVVDVIIGASTFGFLFIQVKRMFENEEGEFCCKMSYFYPRRYDHSSRYENTKGTVPAWLPIVFLVCSGIQFVMGIVLYVAAATKSRKICRVWLYVTGATCLFTGFLIRIYQMLVVSEFSHELEGEHRQVMLANSCRRAIVNGQRVTVPQIQISMDHNDNDNNNSITSTSMNNASNTISERTQGHSGYINDSYESQHQYRGQSSIRHSSQLSSTSTSSFYLPPTPPSYVPPEDEQPPPPYHIAIGCPPAKFY